MMIPPFPAATMVWGTFRHGIALLAVLLIVSGVNPRPLEAALEAPLQAADADEDPWITFQASAYRAFPLHTDESGWERTIRSTGIRAEAGVFEFLSPWVGVTKGSADPTGCFDDDVIGADGDCPPGGGSGWTFQGGLNIRLYTRPFASGRIVRLVPFAGIGSGMSLGSDAETGRQSGWVFQFGADLNMTEQFAIRGSFMGDRVLWPNSTPLVAVGIRYGAL